MFRATKAVLGEGGRTGHSPLNLHLAWVERAMVCFLVREGPSENHLGVVLVGPAVGPPLGPSGPGARRLGEALF